MMPESAFEFVLQCGPQDLSIASTSATANYFGYRVKGDNECADPALMSGNFCLWEDGQGGVTIPASGTTADCGHLSEGRIGTVLPIESDKTVV